MRGICITAITLAAFALCGAASIGLKTLIGLGIDAAQAHAQDKTGTENVALAEEPAHDSKP